MTTAPHLINEDNRLCHNGTDWLSLTRWFTVGVTLMLVGDFTIGAMRYTADLPRTLMAAAGITLTVLGLCQGISACGLTLHLQRVQRLRLSNPLLIPGWLLIFLSCLPLIGLVVWGRLLARIMQLTAVAPAQRRALWLVYAMAGILPWVLLVSRWTLINHVSWIPLGVPAEAFFVVLNALWLLTMTVTAYTTCALAEAVFTAAREPQS